jgi:hypothetical protein
MLKEYAGTSRFIDCTAGWLYTVAIAGATIWELEPAIGNNPMLRKLSLNVVHQACTSSEEGQR